MAINKALGKGLSALFEEGNSPQLSIHHKNEITNIDGEAIIKLELSAIEAGIQQTRNYFDDEKIQELANSIKSNGLILPIIVRYNSEKEKYQIIAGERRWRAAKIAGLEEIPSIVKNFSDKEAMEIGLLENIQRQNLSPVEEAEGYKRLIEDFSYTQEQLAKTLGKSRSHISNLIRILQLPQIVLDNINLGKISASHARSLVTAQNPVQLAEQIINEGLSVRDAEKFALGSGKNKVRNSIKITKPKTLNNSSSKDEDIVMLENAMSRSLGLKVEVDDSEQTGKVVIHFNNLAELDRIIQKIGAGQF